jgi:hypothetical protein
LPDDEPAGEVSFAQVCGSAILVNG